MEQKTDISQISQEQSCKEIDNDHVTKLFDFVEIPFRKSKSGAFYTKFKKNWFLFGFISQEIIDAKVCGTKIFESFEDLQQALKCEPITTATVFGASRKFCPNVTILHDDFDTFDTTRWKHENTMRGGGNWEFQWYVPDPENSFVKDGILHLKPTLTDDKFGNGFVTSKRAFIRPSDCTDSAQDGCFRNGKQFTINPIRSASISTVNSLAFKYGTVEVRAKIASGDWLASAINLFPKDPIFYGQWPFSGEVNMLEARGNRNFTLNEVNIGVEQVGSNIQFGAAWEIMHGEKFNTKGFDKEFHVYKFVWTPEEMATYVDDEQIHKIPIYNQGLWKQFNLGDTDSNPWIKGGTNAPFDKEFYFSISLKAGGVTFFPDDAENIPPKPWSNDGSHAATSFWKGKNDWINTWKDDDTHFQIDYVKITAL